MKELLRAALASLIKAAVTKTAPGPVLDEAAVAHSFRGSIEGSSVQLLSADNTLHLSGSLPNLFEATGATRLFVKIDGTAFNGYDYEAGERFAGKFEAGTVQILDYARARQFEYR